MSILRALKWLGVTLIVVVVAAVLYLSFAELDWLKPRIETAVADATGRQLKLEGPLDIDIVPSPAVLVENVSLSNAEWGSEPALLEVGHLSARVGFWSLVSGPVRVMELRLRDVDVLLETNDQGEANWVMGGPPEPEPPEAEGDGRSPVIIESAELDNIRLRYLAPETEPFVASLASLDITTDADGYTVLDGKGEVDELPLTLAGKLGPDQALATGEDIAVVFDAALGNLALDVDGTIADRAQAARVDIKAVVRTDDITQILEHFAVELPLSGPLQVETVLTSADPGTRLAVDATAGDIAAMLSATQQDDSIRFEAAVPALDKVGKALAVEGLPAEDLVLRGQIVFAPVATELQGIEGRLGEVALQLDGTLGKDADTAEFAFKATGPSLAALSAGLPALPFTAAATAKLAPEQVILEGIETTFGESDLGGSLQVAMGEKTAVSGKLKSQRLDLTPFAGQSEANAEEKGAAGGKKAEPEAGQDKAEGKYVFVEEPLPFQELDKADIDVDADIGRLTLRDMVLLDVSTAVDLEDGGLQLKNRFRGPEGGKSVSAITLTTAGASAELDLNVNMRDLRVNLISGDVKEPSLIPPIGITVDIKSSGSSPRALASTATGRVLFTQGEGQMENDLLTRVSGDVVAQLFRALNPFAKDEKTTTLDCTIAALDITDGKADIAGLLFQTEKVKAVGTGDIDLDTEELNIEFDTKPRKGVGVSADMFVTPFVKLVGTLASPSIGADKKGTLLVGAAVATGGLALVAKGAVDRVAGGVDRCKALLEEVGGHPPLKE